MPKASYGAAHGDLDVGAVATHGLHHLPSFRCTHDVAGHGVDFRQRWGSWCGSTALAHARKQ